MNDEAVIEHFSTQEKLDKIILERSETQNTQVYNGKHSTIHLYR